MWRWDQQEAFGVNVPDENPSGFGAFEFNLRFPGQYADKETNLHYNYFRDYDPSVGRYVQSDPFGISGGINTYGYALTSPLTFVDAEGASQTLITAGAGVVIGGAIGGGLAWMNGGNWQQGMIQGAIAGGVAGLTLGLGGAAISGAFGGGILGGVASGSVAGVAGNLAAQGYANMAGLQCGINWTSVGISAAFGGIFGGYALRPHTAQNQVVTSWAPAGTAPNLNSGRWVMVGNATPRNWLQSGTLYPYANSITGTAPGSQLTYPAGWQSIKGLMGQRVIN